MTLPIAKASLKLKTSTVAYQASVNAPNAKPATDTSQQKQQICQNIHGGLVRLNALMTTFQHIGWQKLYPQKVDVQQNRKNF